MAAITIALARSLAHTDDNEGNEALRRRTSENQQMTTTTTTTTTERGDTLNILPF